MKTLIQKAMEMEREHDYDFVLKHYGVNLKKGIWLEDDEWFESLIRRSASPKWYNFDHICAEHPTQWNHYTCTDNCWDILYGGQKYNKDHTYRDKLFDLNHKDIKRRNLK